MHCRAIRNYKIYGYTRPLLDGVTKVNVGKIVHAKTYLGVKMPR